MAQLQFSESERNTFNALCAGDTFLLSFHQNPDPDSIGSNLALAHFLKNLGKQVTVLWGITGAVESYRYLVKDFLVHTTPITSINPSDYDRLVIIDTAIPERAGLNPEQILIDWNDKVYMIDHHAGNSWDKITPQNNYFVNSIVKPDASSTAELLYDLMIHQKLDMITSEVAEYLKVGIWGDTLGFVYDTDPVLLEKFSKLVAIQPSMDLIQRMERPLELSEIPLFAHMLSQVKVQDYGDKKVCIVHVPSDPESVPSTHLATEFFERFHEVDVVCAYTQCGFEAEAPMFRVSIRSQEKTANGIARTVAQKIGGSGHDNAAGAVIPAQDITALVQLITHAFSE